MSLPVFDESKHHIGLGASEDDLVGLMLAAAYSRSGQQFGADADFGSRADLLEAPRMSRWSMDDFSGGVGRRKWGADPKAFADSLNLVPTKFDKTLRTVPPIVDFAKFDTANEVPVWVGASDGNLFAVLHGGIYKWDATTGARTQIVSGLGTVAANTPRAAVFDRNQKWIGILFDGGVINWYESATGALHVSWGNPITGLSTGDTAHGMIASTTDVIFEVKGVVYKVPFPDSEGTEPASVDYLKLGRLPGTWTDAAVYNGLVYVLANRKDSPPILMQWAGSSGLLPVTEFPYNFQPETVEVYGGRIYVGGNGRDFSDQPRFGMLFEVTGASLRLVRSFKPENGSASTQVRSIQDMAVHEGLLMMGDTGRCIATYDVTTDSFTGGSQLLPPDGVRQLRKLLPYRDTIFVWITHPLDHLQDGWYKVIVPGETATSPYEGIFVTSDFALEPDRDKRWSQFRVLTRGGPATVGYSQTGGAPGGDTFEELTQVTQLTRQSGDLYITTFDLSEVPIGPVIRFRIRMPRGQSATGSTELLSFTASFAFLDTGKWSWQFSVNGTERVELRDGRGSKQDVSDIGTTLRSYWRDRVPLVFRDVDGVSYRVQVTAYSESMPSIGPRSNYQDPLTLAQDSAQEGFHSITLLEV